MKTKHTVSPWKIGVVERLNNSAFTTKNHLWVTMQTNGAQNFELLFPPVMSEEEANNIAILIELAPEMAQFLTDLFEEAANNIVTESTVEKYRSLLRCLPQTEIEDDRNEYYAEFRSANSEGGAKFKAYGMDEVITMLKRDHNNQVEILSIKLVE